MLEALLVLSVLFALFYLIPQTLIFWNKKAFWIYSLVLFMPVMTLWVTFLIRLLEPKEGRPYHCGSESALFEFWTYVILSHLFCCYISMVLYKKINERRRLADAS